MKISWVTFLLFIEKRLLRCWKRQENGCTQMRLLLDESVLNRLRSALPAHEVRTVVGMGWSGVKNGKLLALAAIDFDASLTVDKNLPYQQNLTALPISVVVLDAVSIELPALLPLVPNLERELSALKPRSYGRVTTGTGA